MDFAKLRFPQPSLPDFFMAIVPTLFLIQILKFCIPPLFYQTGKASKSEVATSLPYSVATFCILPVLHQIATIDICPSLPQIEATDK